MLQITGNVPQYVREQTNPKFTQKHRIGFSSESNPKTNVANKNKKNVFPAICSFFIPGLGQFMNNDKKKGFIHLAANVALTGLATFCFLRIDNKSIKNIREKLLINNKFDINKIKSIVKTNKPAIKLMTVSSLAAGALGGLKILSAVDAYKGKQTN